MSNKIILANSASAVVVWIKENSQQCSMLSGHSVAWKKSLCLFLLMPNFHVRSLKYFLMKF
jgi:hypothetical protein